MQPRRPPPPAPLLSLWLLLSLALPAAAATPRDPEITVVPERSLAVGLPPGILQLAGSTALHFFNFRASSPSALRVLAAVQEGRASVSGACAGTATLPARDCAVQGSGEGGVSAFLAILRTEITNILRLG